MTQDEVLQTLRKVIAETDNFTTWTVSTPHLVELVKRAIEAEREARAKVCEDASIIQAITDPENQPSQYGTVTLDYHFAKLKEWEDRFEKLSDRALAQPEQEPVGSVVRWVDGSLIHGWFGDPPPEGTLLYITPPQRQPERGPVAWEQFHEHLVERNFCPRCGKRTADLTMIHTCMPPQEKNT